MIEQVARTPSLGADQVLNDPLTFVESRVIGRGSQFGVRGNVINVAQHAQAADFDLRAAHTQPSRMQVTRFGRSRFGPIVQRWTVDGIMVKLTQRVIDPQQQLIVDIGKPQFGNVRPHGWASRP